MSPLSHAAFAKAGEEVRTPNIQLGRLELCQLSYTRSFQDFRLKILDFRFFMGCGTRTKLGNVQI
jgi:hypothetical protein